MKVFLIILAVLAGIIALICLILSIKLNIAFDYTDKVQLKIKWAFIKFSILPLEKKEKKPKKEKPKKEEPEKPPEEKKPKQKTQKPNPIKTFLNNEGVEGLYEILRQTCAALGGFFGRIVRKIELKEFYFILNVAGKDAADTAIKYGRTCSALFPMFGYICSHMKVGKYDIDISPDYLANQTIGELHADLAFKPLSLTNAAVVLVFQLIFKVVLKFLRGLKTPKQTDSNSNHTNITNTNEGGAS